MAKFWLDDKNVIKKGDVCYLINDDINIYKCEFIEKVEYKDPDRFCDAYMKFKVLKCMYHMNNPLEEGEIFNHTVSDNAYTDIEEAKDDYIDILIVTCISYRNNINNIIDKVYELKDLLNIAK